MFGTDVCLEKGRIYFEMYNDTEFVQRFRLSKNTARSIINDIRGTLQPNTNRNHPVPDLQVLCCLWYYATGSYQKVAGDLAGLSLPPITTSNYSMLVKLLFKNIYMFCNFISRYASFRPGTRFFAANIDILRHSFLVLPFPQP